MWSILHVVGQDKVHGLLNGQLAANSKIAHNENLENKERARKTTKENSSRVAREP